MNIRKHLPYREPGKHVLGLMLVLSLPSAMIVEVPSGKIGPARVVEWTARGQQDLYAARGGPRLGLQAWLSSS